MNNEFYENNNTNILNKEESNSHKIVFIFLILYFGFQIFAQIWGKYLETGIPISKNYLQNFVNTLVLVGILIYFANPNIPINRWITFVIVITYVFMFLYCYAKKGLDEQSSRDSQKNINSNKKSLQIAIIIIYSLLILVYMVYYIYGVNRSERISVLIGVVLLSILYFTFYIFKNRVDTENQFPLSLFIYPVLFLTTGIRNNKVLTYIYAILFTSVASLWGFFGIEWFVKKKKEFEDNINRDMCKAYLGISDNDLSMQPKDTSQTEINKKNIQYIYIAISLIFIVFVLAMLFTYISMNDTM
jgi:heme/copper-type cytochrome/quinol oxidase subunit 2